MDTNETWQRSELSWGRIAGLAARHWQFLAITAVVVTVLTAIFTTLGPAVYTVSIRVVPVKSDKSSNIESLASAAGLGSLLGSSKAGSTFARYRTELTSISVADRIAKNQEMLRSLFPKLWDKRRGTFRSYRPLSVKLFEPIYALAGAHLEAKPGGTLLQGYIKKKLKIHQTTTDDSLVLSMDSAHPQTTKQLLLAINNAANNELRQLAAKRAEAELRYLLQHISQVDNPDLRLSITQLLLQQEQTLVLSQPGLAFAADIIDPPSVSDFPAWPKPMIQLPVAFVVGLLLGFVFLILIDQSVIRFPEASGQKPGCG